MIYTSLPIEQKKMYSVQSIAQSLQPSKNNIVRLVGKYSPENRSFSAITPAKTWSVRFPEETILPNTGELLLVEGYIDFLNSNSMLIIIPTAIFRFPKKSVVRDTLHFLAKKDIPFTSKCLGSFSMCIHGKIKSANKSSLTILQEDTDLEIVMKNNTSSAVLLQGEEVTLKVTSISHGEVVAVAVVDSCTKALDEFTYNNILGGVLNE